MKNLYKALAGFQQDVPTIHKGTKGYGYTYADLSQILDVINPFLAKYDLGFTQLIQGNEIKTIIFHYESGESLESSISIPQGVTLKGMNEFQVLGSAITYLRRYALSSALGIVTDKDTDASGETATKTQTKEVLTNTHKHYKAISEKLATGAVTIEVVEKSYDISKVKSELEKYVKLNKIV